MASFHGNFGIYLRAYIYAKLHGHYGLRQIAETSVVNANYLKKRLSTLFTVPYSQHCMHEFVIQADNYLDKGIKALDIAKRLLDYDVYAPTVYFPLIVKECMLIEPTESESKPELDRFCDAMISIREEIREVEQGKYSAEESVLRNAPHTQYVVTADSWDKKYLRQKAGFPLGYLREFKIWPAVGRVDNAFGDKNFICTCPALSEYES
jgi:glycine cleavage system protein P-like pyridoxal-binding family